MIFCIKDDILGNISRKYLEILEDRSYGIPVFFYIIFFYVLAVRFYRTGPYIIEPHEKLDKSCLAGTVITYKSNLFPWPYVEVQAIYEHIRILSIGKGNILKFYVLGLF